MNLERRRAWTIPLGLLSAIAASSHAAPPPPMPGLTLRGQATRRFLGLAIYEARLWTGAGFEPERYPTQRFALELSYFGALSGIEIAERSLLEMRRQEALGDEREAAWRSLMQRAFPDVGKGDRLTGEHDGAGAVRFLHNDRPTASTQDADFARLFFGIWLSLRTSDLEMRSALIAA